jgi:hypothetical protein
VAFDVVVLPVAHQELYEACLLDHMRRQVGGRLKLLKCLLGVVLRQD